MSEIIHIYHTNDLHSHFENWPRIDKFLKERRQLHQETGEEAIILDIGDHVDRWHPYTEGTLGKGNIELLNEAGYQYVTIGNNEGITLPHEALDSLYENAKFQVLAANIYNQNNERPEWALPYWIHTTAKGTKIAMIGLTAYFQKFYSAMGWELTEPFTELKTQLHKIKGEADAIIILSHLGIHDDERMAEDFPEIDVILGAHTHHILHQGKLVNNTLLCGAGKYGFFIGQVEMSVNEEMKVCKKRAILYDTNDLPELEDERSWIEEMYQAGGETLQQVAVNLPESLENEWFKVSPLTEILGEALREWSEADCTFLNAGLLLDGLPKGPVTKGDIHRICPHPINPCIVEVNGNELKEILMQSRNEEWPHIQIKGFGFRGKIMGVMHYDQIEFKEVTNGIVKEILINGEKLQPHKSYKLAIPDMFTFGHFFPSIQRSNRKDYLLPEFLRDILLWKLKKVYPNE
ncbi:MULTISPECIES: bifunctional metallophosphatase/5'-nucleotidase [unclassified Peribacillus]|uniref:bifunctional metallophosphatase/5'-nucleotidase n=1 Tax=unclassified Peribacillus TaxID=2675266 RepID=UPI001913E201|nr:MULTISPECIES: bifunctional UDP-sugar hydrolase/5'-nucleotidase [unclassified Peribacillus]MBK5485224.1 bifunctional metallophosphatase/5'-nucleotidase [Peribacillus sp. TH16]MBK5499594.1 bifunctional metallophosphatase/5'-nucleotidase [Peribacillus sp. TH14]WMX55320.1 bifunctional UDP-sugar hydrolase/5'-nucleotidase [Peribacillus sp. R9-11]